MNLPAVRKENSRIGIKKLLNLIKAISEKNIEVIYDQMSDELKEHGDKLRSKLKKFCKLFPLAKS